MAGDPELLDLVAALLSEIILYVARTPTPPPVVQRLLQSDALRHNYEIDEYWISGGVAECMRNAETGRSHETAGCGESAGNAASALWQFGDFGVLLAHGLRAALAERNLNYKIADVGIRATVIGAGMHALQLSGFTVEVSDNVLPLRNVQIVQPFRPGDTALEENEIAAKIQILLERGELNNDELPVAISICDISSLPYTKLQAWARALVAAHRRHRSSQPLIVLSQEDIGLALGQTIKIYAPEIDLVILDGVDTSLGDFIDIGSILANKNAVPLTVKSLIFNN